MKITLSALVKLFSKLGEVRLTCAPVIKHSYFVSVFFKNGHVGTMHFNYKTCKVDRESEIIKRYLKKIEGLMEEDELAEETQDLFSEYAYNKDKGILDDRDWEKAKLKNSAWPSRRALGNLI